MKPHYMVKPEHSSMPQVMAQAGYVIVIAALPKLLGVRWGRSPVLAILEYWVRGGPDRSLVDEHVLVSPDIISIWMDT